MTCIGIAWASILSMPYAMLTPALPKDKVGVLMGMFNLFIVFPQIIASTFLGEMLNTFLGGNPVNAMYIAGTSMGIASLLTLIVVTYKRSRIAEDLPKVPAGH
jgi:maltose/moltooligosaccharide transporter